MNPNGVHRAAQQDAEELREDLDHTATLRSPARLDESTTESVPSRVESEPPVA